ncbi:MAG: hypothetical protein JWP74_4206 [Marmoricola sp.]|nr:hypothetical protein [Marmoricola sp.]
MIVEMQNGDAKMMVRRSVALAGGLDTRTWLYVSLARVGPFTYVLGGVGLTVRGTGTVSEGPSVPDTNARSAACLQET